MQGGIDFENRHERDARDVYLGTSRDGDSRPVYVFQSILALLFPV